MTYTQDESYCILDCKDDGGVYLGLKEGIDKNQMLTDLKCAQEGHISFNAEKYVNKFHAKKHDHFLIPAETFIVSAKVKEYTIKPLNDETIKVIKAYVRN